MRNHVCAVRQESPGYEKASIIKTKLAGSFLLSPIGVARQ
jgi:hypothetical protein